MLPSELEMEIFCHSRKLERTEGSVSSPRKKTDIRDCSACLWQGLLETEGRAEPAGSCDSWTACWDPVAWVPLLTVQLWTSYLTSLNLHFVINKRGTWKK